MNKDILLSEGKLLDNSVKKINDNKIDVDVMALHPGKFIDANGTPVEITNEIIEKICDYYNKELSLISGIFNTENKNINITTIPEEKMESRNNNNENKEEEYEHAPVQLDHDMSVRNTVGFILGKMRIEYINGEANLFVKLRIKKRENVENIEHKLWRKVSMRFNLETFKTTELSFVTKPAAPMARVLSDGSSKLTNKQFNSKNEIALSLKDVHQKIKDHEKELEQLNTEKKVNAKLCYLIKSGSLTPAQAKLCKNDLMLQSSPIDRDITLRLMNNLPKQVAFGNFNRNVQAYSLEDVLMNGNEIKIEQALTKVKEIFGNDKKNNKSDLLFSSKEKKDDKTQGIVDSSKKESNHTHGEEHEIKIHKEEIKHLIDDALKSGNNKLAKKLSSYLGEEEGEKIHQEENSLSEGLDEKIITLTRQIDDLKIVQEKLVNAIANA